MQIVRVNRAPELLRVDAVVDGKVFEFVSSRSGPIEVYDFPPNRKGVARCCGYMPEETSCKLRAILRRLEGEDDRSAERVTAQWLEMVRNLPRKSPVLGRASAAERSDIEYHQEYQS